MAHHSPAIGEETESSPEGGNDNDAQDSTLHGEQKDAEPLLTYGVNNVLHHLHLSLASPAVFRLPTLAYRWSGKDGSGFLFAYVVVLLVVALPLGFLEQIMAQFSSLGTITIFRCLPVLTGVGVGMVAACGVLMLYSGTLFTWATIYLFECMQDEVPWAACEPNATQCIDVQQVNEKFNSSTIRAVNSHWSFEYYFLKHVVQALGPDADKYKLVLSLSLMQLFLWLMLVPLLNRREMWKGTILSKVLALLQLTMFLALAVVGIQQDESGRGLSWVFKFNSKDLKHPDIWLDALGQVLWSLGPGIGLLISRSSYNKFRERIRVDIYTSVGVNLVVVIIVHLALFPVLGNTYTSTTKLENIPGHLFTLSSEVVSQMGVPQLAGVVLYLGVCKSLLHHTEMLASTLAVSVNDLLPISWRGGSGRFLCNALVCLVGFLFSLLFVTRSGIYFLSGVDAYVPWMAGLPLGLLEACGLVYLYGTDKIKDHFRTMMRKNTYIFPIMWRFILPPALLALVVWVCVVGVGGPVTYANLGIAFGLLPICSCVLATLVTMWRYRKAPKTLIETSESWGPALAKHRDFYTTNFLRLHDHRPFLVVQMEQGYDEEGSLKGWLPYGYFWQPPREVTIFLREHSDADLENKSRVAGYLKEQFSSNTLWEEDDQDEDPILPTASTKEMYQAKMQSYRRMLSGVLGRRQRGSSVSSGVVLSPLALTDVEAKAKGWLENIPQPVKSAADAQ